MKIGLETESFHLQFITGRMDIFGFIRKQPNWDQMES